MSVSDRGGLSCYSVVAGSYFLLGVFCSQPYVLRLGMCHMEVILEFRIQILGAIQPCAPILHKRFPSYLIGLVIVGRNVLVCAFFVGFSFGSYPSRRFLLLCDRLWVLVGANQSERSPPANASISIC